MINKFSKVHNSKRIHYFHHHKALSIINKWHNKNISLWNLSISSISYMWYFISFLMDKKLIYLLFLCIWKVLCFLMFYFLQNILSLLFYSFQESDYPNLFPFTYSLLLMQSTGDSIYSSSILFSFHHICNIIDWILFKVSDVIIQRLEWKPPIYSLTF